MNETEKATGRISIKKEYEARKVVVVDKQKDEVILTVNLGSYPAGATITKVAIYGVAVILQREVATTKDNPLTFEEAVSKLAKVANDIEQGRWEPGKSTLTPYEKALNRFRKEHGREPNETERATIKMAADMGLIK